MTSFTMDDGNWGERRMSARLAQQRGRRIRMVILGVAIMVGLPFVGGLIDGFSHSDVTARHDDALKVVSAVLFVAVVAWFALSNWRERDEVERRSALNVWAALGLAALVLNPVLRAIQPLLHLADPAQTAWVGSLIAGGATIIYQKVRR